MTTMPAIRTVWARRLNVHCSWMLSTTSWGSAASANSPTAM